MIKIEDILKKIESLEENRETAAKKGKQLSYYLIGIYGIIVILLIMTIKNLFALTFLLVATLIGLLLICGWIIFLIGRKQDQQFIDAMNQAVYAYHDNHDASLLLNQLMQIQTLSANENAIDLWKINIMESLLALEAYDEVSVIMELTHPENKNLIKEKEGILKQLNKK
ncbi:hypothetical protein HMPREF9943_01213 [Eggerthia catenaformis OT 569 = DSM 20559]|uniref:Uncharacterized protein n=1 Tax=Eggerthia catenaformis OT 569 = DSM 20559 TaxID=999415 RepID=M2PM70_9FIRM|nr:hypothetical protein [Eggerthia catenaformis]EMD16659.1 hypothetical protein HMPREF9943_01213 [Eggerthia catenaformis OT 569 = DSM 20559]